MEQDSKNIDAQLTLIKSERKVKITFWLVFSITTCVFGNSFLFGHNIGVLNSPTNLIRTFYKQVYLARNNISTVYNPENKSLCNGIIEDCNTGISSKVWSEKDIKEDNFINIMWSITVALFVFFGMIGAFLSGKIADQFGRKNGMVVVTFLVFAAALLGGIPTVAKSPECLLISRVFVGLHSGISITLASLYLAEISPKKIRGSVGTCNQLFITIGIFWSMVLGLPEIAGDWKLWPLLFAFNAIPALACLILMPLCPESPRYLLIKKNDEENAKKALVKLRGYDDVEDELEEMRTEVRRALSLEQFTMKRLLTTSEFRLPLIIAVLMQVAQQLSGINAVMNYSNDILSEAKVSDKTIPYVLVGQGAINVIATIFAVPLMEMLGRRPLLIFPMIEMVFSFLMLMICTILLQSPDYDEEQKRKLTIICITVLLTYVIGFAVGLGPIPFIVVSELFRQEPRAAAMSFALSFNWMSNFLLVLTFTFIQKGIGPYTFLIFIVVLVASITFIAIFVPETKNKTFDEIAQSISFRRIKQGRLIEEADMHEMHPMSAEKV